MKQVKGLDSYEIRSTIRHLEGPQVLDYNVATSKEQQQQKMKEESDLEHIGMH